MFIVFRFNPNHLLNQNLVMEYPHEQAVADGVNVNYDVYRIRTKITHAGLKVDAGYFIDKRDRETRAVRWERLDEELLQAVALGNTETDVISSIAGRLSRIEKKISQEEKGEIKRLNNGQDIKDLIEI